MSRSRGQWAETMALGHLRAQGLIVVERNYSCRRGELDLICLDGPELAFVEVRYRQPGALVDALESIDEQKMARIRTAATHFLNARSEHATRVCRFDVVTVSGTQTAPSIDWLKDAFE